MIAAQDHGMVLVGNQSLLAGGEVCPGGIPRTWKPNECVLVGLRRPTFGRKLCPAGPATAGMAIAPGQVQLADQFLGFPPAPLSHYTTEAREMPDPRCVLGVVDRSTRPGRGSPPYGLCIHLKLHFDLVG
jgi:hypothetical protein